MVKTQITGRLAPGETADFTSKFVVGYSTIERTLMHRGELQPPKTEQALVFEPSEFSDYLGPTRNGIKALTLGFGDAQILEWPFTHYPQLRPSYVPAEWVASYESENVAPIPIPPPIPDRTPVTNSAIPVTPPKAKPRWGENPPAGLDIYRIAETGSDLRDAPDPWSDMTTDPSAGGVK